MSLRIAVFLLLSINLNAQTIINMQLKSSLPSYPRADYGAVLIDSNYYVVGGADSTGMQISEVWRYRVTTDQWQRMNDFPGGPVGEHQCFAIGQKIYLVAGADSISGYACCDNEFWEYDTQTDTWNHRSNFPGGKREVGTAFSYRGKGYYAFGSRYPDGFQNDIWQYDPNMDIWTVLPDTLPASRRIRCINTQVYNSVYFLGGLGGIANTNFVELSDLWRYDILSGTWDSLSPIPGNGRELCILYGFKNFLLAGYGGNQNGVLGGSYTYDYISKHWTTATINNFVPGIACNQNSCFTYKSTAYLFGGIKNSGYNFYNNVWSFDATPYALLTGVDDVNANDKLNVYPNPVTAQHPLMIHSPAEGSISFYNAIGQILYTTFIHPDDNQISFDELHMDGGVLFYTATFRNGATQNGKVIMY